jgi:sulfur carrier protein
MITLKINGKEKHFAPDNAPKTLSELIKQMELIEETVVAEINGQIIERKNFATTQLKPEHNIELIRFVGGG